MTSVTPWRAHCASAGASAIASVRATFGFIWRRGEGKFSLLVLAAWIFVCLLAVFWTPQPLSQSDGYNTWASPTPAHPMGTDGTGRDMLSWLMAGSGTELQIVVATCLLAALIGVLFVSFSLARSGLVSEIAVVITDTLLSIPIVLIALILAVPLGASLLVVIVSCGLSYGLNLARIAKPAASLAANARYSEASRAAGSSRWHIFRAHVLPNLIPVFSVQLSICAGTAILAEAGLTYLGIGVPAGTASWGASLSSSASFISIFPLTVVWPGALITLVVVALNVFGDCLRAAVDPVVNSGLRARGSARPHAAGKVTAGRKPAGEAATDAAASDEAVMEEEVRL
ncbi:MAG: ABC transporter permease [Bifidobacteriaceae bacterium]|nr:ABC transporter permease [Bifidobacteriaceae bacterium]